MRDASVSSESVTVEVKLTDEDGGTLVDATLEVELPY